VEAAVIGRVTAAPPGGTGILRILEASSGAVLAELAAASLADEAPRYDRPRRAPAASQLGDPAGLDLARRCEEDLLALLADPSFIFSQYDHQLFLNTVFPPGVADASLLRLAAPGVPPSAKALALSADGNPGWCALDPRMGTAATVAESALNVSLVGAEPLALVNCLNFGNPEHEEVMWQLSEAVDGMASACTALQIPVVGGNVSLYNESDGADIDPTPVVAVVGLVAELRRRPPGIGWREGDTVVLLGEAHRGLGGSRFARRLGCPGGHLEELDLAAHQTLCRFVAALIAAEAGLEVPPGLISGAHDLSDGGLALALAESALRAGTGITVGPRSGTGELFSEGPSRVLLATPRPGELLEQAAAAGIPSEVLGVAGGARLVVDGLIDLSLEELARRYEAAIPEAIDATAP
jgi:phosphoribosylformylglycinamidine synthase